MRSNQAFSITLPPDMAKMVRDKVASGEYASESDVVRDGLRILAERDAAQDQWLADHVAPAFDAYKADPGRAAPLEDAMERVRGRVGKGATGGG